MNKPLNFLATLFILVVLFSCGKNSEEINPLIFQNNFEKITCWNDGSNNVQTLIKSKEAYSGKFVSKTDTIYRYSYLFKAKLGDMHDKAYLKANASVWVKVKSLDARAVVVLSVDSAGTMLNWNGKEIAPLIVKANEWTEIKHELIFEDSFNKPEFILGFYVWNNGNYEVLVDDMKLEMIE